MFPRHDSPGWVVRIADQNSFSTRGKRRFDSTGGYLEIITGIGWHPDWSPPCQRYLCSIGDVARLRDDHLVAGIEDGSQGQVKRLTHADSYQNLFFGIVVDAVQAVNILRHSQAQRL